MLDALNSITARPVGPVNAATPGARRDAGAGNAAFPGLGDYGRPSESKGDSVRENASGIAKNGPPRPGNGGQDAENASEGDSLRLSPEAQAQLRELRQRDAEVRSHEQAHMAAGGQYVTGGASYDYQQGPDGRQYAIGGHVSIDASSIPGDPEGSAAKARQVRRAALAPGEPSAQDRAVAARASAAEAEAGRETREEDGDGQGVDGVEAARRGEAHARAQAASGAENAPPDAAARPENPVGPESAESSSGRGGIGHALLRAAETYAAMAQRGVMPTALAPGGTGISLQI